MNPIHFSQDSVSARATQRFSLRWGPGPASAPHSQRCVGLIPGLGPFCAEFACSHRVCVGSPQFLRLHDVDGRGSSRPPQT